MSSTTVILARDLDPDQTITNPNLNRWSLGKIRYVIAALDGAPVAITTDTQTGSTALNARLIEAFYGGPARGERLTVETTLSDGTTQRTNFPVDNIGMILPLTAEAGVRGPKWDAKEALRNDCQRAIEVARERLTGGYGRWETRASRDGIGVSYRPHKNPPTGEDAGRFEFTEVLLHDLAAQPA